GTRVCPLDGSLSLACLLGVEVSDVGAAEGQGLRLQPGVHFTVDAARHGVDDGGSHHHRAVAAHEDHGPIAECLREGGAQHASADEHVAHPTDVANLEHRHALDQE